MARHTCELTDEQWAHIRLPEPKASPKGGPKPIANRPVFEGILWVLRSGARWQDLPERYPSPSTCWRRLRAWEIDGVWLKAWRALLGQLDEANWTGVKPSLTAVLPRRKKGALRGQNQTRKGYEVDGGGRRPGSSSGKLTWTRRPRPKSG